LLVIDIFIILFLIAVAIFQVCVGDGYEWLQRRLRRREGGKEEGDDGDDDDKSSARWMGDEEKEIGK
jgi:hypothetical protein